MTRTLCTLLFLFLEILAFGQTGFRIDGENIDAVKAGDRFLTQRNDHWVEKIRWGQVLSECVSPAGVEWGKWFTLKPKMPEATIRVKFTDEWGDLSGAIVYVGSKRTHKGQEILTELKCEKALPGQKEIILSFNDLVPKQEYYILVGSETANKRDRFTIHVWTEYIESQTELTENPKTQEDYVSGRVRDKSGKGKADILVSVLDKSNKPIETASTDSKGSFTFKKLPIDVAPIIRIEEDDTKLTVDLFLFGNDGKVKEKATRLGKSLYGFGADESGFTQLRLLSERDWAMNVASGKTGVMGRVVDAETFLFGQANVAIGLYSSDRNKLASSTTDINGKFAFKDLSKGDYLVKVEGNQVKNYSEMVMVDDLNVPYYYANSAMIGKDGFFKFEKLPPEIVELKRMQEKDARMKLPTDFTEMESGKAIVLKNLLFESGSSTIVATSNLELDQLSAELLRKANTRIEISGHTDNTGNSAANMALSTGRAESVKSYLVNKGIDPSRIECKGYGETKPVGSNDTEAGRTQNRRVEFRVIK